MRHQLMPIVVAVAASACGSGGEPGAAPPPAASVQSPTPEAQLARVTLSAEAEAHLALQVETAATQAVTPTRSVGGEAIVPPGRAVTVSAPVAGTLAAPDGDVAGLGAIAAGDVILDLLPLQQSDRDLGAQAERDATEADARLTEANQRLSRLQQLLQEGSASVRAVEEARANQVVAEAAAEAARTRLSTLSRLPVGDRGQIALTAPFPGTVTALHASPGQTVAAGAPVADLARTDALWIRVPVYAGDLASVDTSQPASYTRLGPASTDEWREVRRVDGPPVADPTAASVDLYFALPNPDGVIRPGERLTVQLPLRSEERAIVIPQSAVVYDVGGGTWVYEAAPDHVYIRRRVELGTIGGSNVVVRRGLEDGTRIVTVGAAELFGTEFYVTR